MKKKFFEIDTNSGFYSDGLVGIMSLRTNGYFEDGSTGHVIYCVPKDSMFHEDGTLNRDASTYDYSYYKIYNKNDEVVGDQDNYEIEQEETCMIKISFVVHKDKEKKKFEKYVKESLREINETVFQTLIMYGIKEESAIECASLAELAAIGDVYNTDDFDVCIEEC